jgi:ribosomal protein S18 acetylase RimI-like enzyme
MISNEMNPVQTPHGKISTRPETSSDTAFLFTLHESVKGAEFVTMTVGDPIRRQLLDMQFRAMTMSYRTNFPSGRFEIVILNGTPIGRLITDHTQNRFRIVYIALLPEWRRCGIAVALMTSVLQEPRRRGTRCEATLARDNLPSQRLWSRLGFTECARDDANLVLEWQPP